jgi:hypothetical protein
MKVRVRRSHSSPTLQETPEGSGRRHRVQESNRELIFARVAIVVITTLREGSATGRRGPVAGTAQNRVRRKPSSRCDSHFQQCVPIP